MKNSLWLSLGFSLSLLTLAGCSGGSGSEVVTEESGELKIALTDAQDDFLTYEVKLESIDLVRSDGTVVSVLATTTQVDFAQYQDINELFAVLSIPVGVYESVRMNLDYSEAVLTIQDQAGETYRATAVNGDGNPLAQLSVTMNLNEMEEVVITPGRGSQLTLDLDLSASNAILSFDPPLVEVEPYFMATTQLDEDREHRVRGLLDSVDEEADTVTFDILPMRLQAGEYGEVMVSVSNETRYEINGVESVGDAGLAVLADLPEATPLVAVGAVVNPDGSTEGAGSFVATRVLAGSSVAWAGKDVLKGIVRSRIGNVIRVASAVVESGGSTLYFDENVVMTIDGDTQVTGYSLGEADVDQVTVGQRIEALGDWQFGNFDARGEVVRLPLNQINGQVVSTSPLVLDVSTINGRSTSRFNFQGTGVDSLEDSDPDAYEVNASGLNLGSLEAGDWVAVRGYPVAHGSAPADFDALSVIDSDFTQLRAALTAHWETGSENPIAVVGDNLVLNDNSLFERVVMLGAPWLLTAGIQTESVAGIAAEGRFGLLGGGEVELYRYYSDLLVALADRLAQGGVVRHVSGGGSFDPETGVFTADTLMVGFETIE